jgi:hypothetical protein
MAEPPPERRTDSTWSRTSRMLGVPAAAAADAIRCAMERACVSRSAVSRWASEERRVMLSAGRAGRMNLNEAFDGNGGLASHFEKWRHVVFELQTAV